MDKLIARCRAMPGVGQQCLVFKPTLTEMGNTLEQILAALGAGAYGTGSEDGYSMLAEDVGLYGPDFELPEQPTSGRGIDTAAVTRKDRHRTASDARDADLPGPKASERLKLQRDVKFPLRYRNLVGEYFRVVAESQAE